MTLSCEETHFLNITAKAKLRITLGMILSRNVYEAYWKHKVAVYLRVKLLLA